MRILPFSWMQTFEDDIAVIDLFLDSYAQGHDIVYGVRSSREQDSWFKRTSALLFYRLQHSMGVEAVYNHADCRLLSRRILQDLARFPEINLYLRGMIPLIGYQSDIVEYERQRRSAGTSKYPLKKCWPLPGMASLHSASDRSVWSA